MKQRTWIIGMFFFVLFGCSVREDLAQITLRHASGRSITLWVEVADDPSERGRGLVGREELPEQHGMLFVFDRPQVLSFWMKDALIPLDILFFDAAGTFVSAQTMEPCLLPEAPSGARGGLPDPCPVYSSLSPAKYALEVGAGFVKQKKVEAGWTFQVGEKRKANSE